MENEFAKAMSERTDEELIKIVTIERDQYQSSAILAAEKEVEIRNIDTSSFEETIEKYKIEKEEIENANSNIVSSGVRFINFLIDTTVCFIGAFVLGLIPVLIFDVADVGVEQGLIPILFNLFLLITYIAYYIIMENKYHKTIGKFVTKTKVVKMNGDAPTKSDITTRTFCRLIPFDRVSFFFTKNGIHDFLSKTKVVKDKV